MNATHKILGGDALTVLRGLPEKSVHMMVTSPAYYSPKKGLRDYKVTPIDWGDGYVGDLGKEPHPSLYVDHLVSILREAKRVLRDDGTLWLNIGDSHAGSGCGPSGKTGCIQNQQERQGHSGESVKIPDGYKRKEIFGVPFLVGEALRRDGWYWRSIIPWFKHNGMPGSYTDRPISTIEFVLILTKTPKNYYDHVAVLQKSSESYRNDKRPVGVLRQRANENTKYDRTESQFKKQDGTGNATYTGFNARWKLQNRDNTVRFLRESDFFFQSFQGMWLDEDNNPMAIVLNTKGYAGAHFATFPVALPEICILASTSEKGVCPECGAPWVRVEGSGWKMSCSCQYQDPVPATVLDMFNGSGASGVAALTHNRNYIGIELKPEYCSLAEERIRKEVYDRQPTGKEVQGTVQKADRDGQGTPDSPCNKAVGRRATEERPAAEVHGQAGAETQDPDRADNTGGLQRVPEASMRPEDNGVRGTNGTEAMRELQHPDNSSNSTGGGMEMVPAVQSSDPAKEIAFEEKWKLPKRNV